MDDEVYRRDGAIPDEAVLRLPRDEEARLWALAKSGNDEARERLILTYRSLVFWLAKKFHVSRASFPDMIQEGMLALIDAVDRFEPERGFRFATFAYYRIRGKMVNFLQRVEARAPIPVDEDEHVQVEEADQDRLDWAISLEEGLAQLRGREAEVVQPLLVEGEKARTYARDQGVDVSHIYRIQRKAMAKLRVLLGIDEPQTDSRRG
jgi:RNA polymerase sporulation-specific sigma factor